MFKFKLFKWTTREEGVRVTSGTSSPSGLTSEARRRPSFRRKRRVNFKDSTVSISANNTRTPSGRFWLPTKLLAALRIGRNRSRKRRQKSTRNSSRKRQKNARKGRQYNLAHFIGHISLLTRKRFYMWNWERSVFTLCPKVRVSKYGTLNTH